MTANNQQISEVLDDSYASLNSSLIRLSELNAPIHFIRAVTEAMQSIDAYRQQFQQEDTEAEYHIRALRRQATGFSGVAGTISPLTPPLMPAAVREEIEKLVTKIIDERLSSQPGKQLEEAELVEAKG